MLLGISMRQPALYRKITKMKKLLVLALSITLFSCKKDPASPSGYNTNGSIQYKVNGQLTVMDNVDILSGQYVTFAKQLKGLLPQTRYLLNGQKGVNNLIGFTIVTDSLLTTNYHYDSASITDKIAVASFVVTSNGQVAALFYSTDNFDISITDYNNSRVSATFSGRFTPLLPLGGGFGQPGSVNITEGIIKNVQVVY